MVKIDFLSFQVPTKSSSCPNVFFFTQKEGVRSKTKAYHAKNHLTLEIYKETSKKKW